MTALQRIEAFFQRTSFSFSSFEMPDLPPADQIAIHALSGAGKSTTLTLLAVALPGSKTVSGGDFQRAENKDAIDNMAADMFSDPQKGTDRACEAFLLTECFKAWDNETLLIMEARLSHMITAQRRVFRVRLECPLDDRAIRRRDQLATKNIERTFIEIRRDLCHRDKNDQERFAALYPNCLEWYTSPSHLVVSTKKNRPEVVADAIVTYFQKWKKAGCPVATRQTMVSI
jgi:cytidylate kinase